jgi:hypothetical protein
LASISDYEDIMRITALFLIVAIFALGVPSAHAQDNEAAAWRQVADAIPLGSKVKVQTVAGARLSGTLMRVDGSAIMLKRNTRRPEPAITVAFTDVSKLEREQPGGGTHIAKAIGVGLAAGAGVFFSLILIALQMD